MNADQTLTDLLELSNFLGEERHQMAILGEGNTSARIDHETFWVKASGSCLATLTQNDLVACRLKPLLAMLEQPDLTDQQIEAELFACRVDSHAKKPSVETLFHAYLLSLPGVAFVGHTHGVAVNQILCSPLAEKFATRKLFPDEVVCCGPQSVLVPYTDPGLLLSQAIRDQTQEFMDEYGAPPRVILLQNHGLITLGQTPSAVKAAMLMAQKSAEIFVGAATLGGPVFMSPEDVDRIANRSDEHYRQRALKL
ncbi:MAG: rhamnose utilization protein RhaD (predicted bifunctional aldolase and dehydrogenase) [Mariniblastus sp.]|jgi:rhamnose utilization protein RhaD (predicted bifunctional aldolase and dehydrogenase)